MNLGKRRVILGAILFAAGLSGLAVASVAFVSWGHPSWSMMNGVMSMMGRLNQGTLTDVNGTVEKVERISVELWSYGREVEVHGPYWFWQEIGIKEGDVVTAKGMFVSMMEPNEGWHEELVPFELSVNGRTYGNVNNRIPVWMQE